jgi:Fe-S cluster assembly protein SufD
MTMTATTTGATTDLFRAAFEASVEQDPPALRDLRRAAYERFLVLGLPTTRAEDWKYTSLAPLARTTFGPAPAARATPDDLRPLAFGTLGGHRAVFVNGRLAPELSSLDSLPVGVQVRSCAEALAGAGRALIDGLDDLSDPFEAFNRAFSTDGAVVGVPAGVVVEEPIYLFFYSTNPGGDAPLVAVRNRIVAHSGSQVTLVEAYGGPEGERYLTNAVTEAVVADGAVVRRLKLQRESTAAFHVARLRVVQGPASHFADFSVALGAALYRNDIETVFDGEGGECSLDGLFMASGDQHTDTHTRIDHARPRCSSRELYKGILDGKARGVFHGRIVVRKDAQKTDAYQTNKNLLLSREALVNSTPQLEILADDVKCKHGSTTGQLDAAALFYLRSRGIGEASARSLLTHAFASDVVQHIPVADVRAGFEAYLQSRLPGAAEVREAVA